MNEETKSSDIYEHPYNDLIQEGNWYDHGTGIFELKQSRFGLWTSYDKEGKGIITALTKGKFVTMELYSTYMGSNTDSQKRLRRMMEL